MLHALFKFLVLCLLYSQGKGNHYCQIKKNHTMCKYRGVGQNCINPKDYGVLESHQEQIMYHHNTLRSYIAFGEEDRGAKGKPQPGASNMLKMVWDNELSVIAQRWADQCTNKHDERDVPRFDVGQNLYLNRMGRYEDADWRGIIFDWYDEVQYFNPKMVTNYTYHISYGQYSQMMWHDSYRIGCGRRDWGSNKIYVCNYGPAGNLQGQLVYLPGKACSKCPPETKCEKGLCAYSDEYIRSDLVDREQGGEGKSRKKRVIDVKDRRSNTNLLVFFGKDGQYHTKAVPFSENCLNSNTKEERNLN